MAERIRQSGGAYRGVMPIVLAASRSMPGVQVAAAGLKWVSPDVLRRKEADCPADVPIARIARFMTERARRHAN